ncbi:hypothetical protein HIM_03960 [Hirsutella minnesotensis 3608]|uniref:Uncharacterized protein n=1 Tax=Hirsutella minnesotensis 3608 TaxID=1043627 RepID=A0A0F8A682_9HYPO|nr:hypothetical protein HIM_03960 [Hirsutella minnesotensis 3608]
MPFAKDRLYVALYVRGGLATMPDGEDRYHWALIIGPKSEGADARGTKVHAKERLVIAEGKSHSVWELEESQIELAPTGMILVRVLVAKVKNRKRLVSILQSVPVRGGQPGWNCVGWVKEALELAQKDGKALRTAVVDWQTVRDAAMRYALDKEAAHRFDGKAEPGEFNMAKVPTWNLLKGSESVA